ncbi:MAG: radical SAM protein [Pyrodictiaceae archaeon]
MTLQASRGYDPIVLARAIEPLVTGPGRLRRYYRFRRDRWYGGVATGDVVGCNLRCGFCWAYRFAWHGYDRGTLMSPGEVAERLYSIARRSGLKQARVSGGEPTIGFDHLVGLVEEVTGRGLHMIIETNGILLGAREDYAARLAEFHGLGLEVRVSLKGSSPEEFHRLTGARRDAWLLQLRALELLVDYGLEPGDEVYPAVMLSFSSEENIEELKRRLKAIHPKLVESLDPEYVILYPHVEKLIKMMGLRPRRAYRPWEVPEELV